MNLPAKYHITTFVNDEVVGEFQKPIEDPFINHTVTLGFRALVLSLFRGHCTVNVLVGGSKEIVDAVLGMAESGHD